MFSRRHPFLFFILAFTGIAGSSIIVVAVLIAVSTDRPRFARGEKVGIVEINGVIIESRQILEQLKTFREAPAIKAVVVRINSPGGAVGPSQEIYREIQKIREDKTVVASMGAVAASGGYYIASAAERIIASPGTITGSIGVMLSYTNLEELFSKLGLDPVIIKSGEYKDMASPMRTMAADEEAILRDFAEDIHRQFISHVADGRGMPLEEVSRIADGRIYTGKKARQLGLIDEFGNLEDAVEQAGRMGGITGPVTAVYPPEKKTFSLLEFIMGGSAVDILHRLAEQQGFSHGISGGYLYQPGR